MNIFTPRRSACRIGRLGNGVLAPLISEVDTMTWKTTVAALLLALLAACGGGGDDQTIGSATVVSVAQTGTVGMELSKPVEVRLLDSWGNPVVGKAMKFVVSDSIASAVPSVTTSDLDGFIRTRWTLGGVAGSQSLAITADEPSSAPVTYAIHEAIATVGPLAKVEVVAGDRQRGRPGERLPVLLRVRTVDRFDNPIMRMMISFVPQNGGATAINHVLTNDDGTTSTAWTLGPSPGTQWMVVTASPISPAPELHTAATASAEF